MIIDDTEWMDYTPDDPHEWEQCAYCRCGLEHTVEEHREAIVEARHGLVGPQSVRRLARIRRYAEEECDPLEIEEEL